MAIVPTIKEVVAQTITTEVPMSYGYEECTSCAWRHIFWADEGDPKPELIAGLGLGPKYVCPSCHQGGARRCLLSSPVPVDTWFVNLRPRMTWRQQLRAIVRWAGPWDEEMRGMILSIGVVYVAVTIVTSVIAVATSDWLILIGLFALDIFILKLCLVWRGITTLLVLALSLIGDRRHNWQIVRKEWYELGRDPFFRRYAN